MHLQGKTFGTEFGGTPHALARKDLLDPSSHALQA